MSIPSAATMDSLPNELVSMIHEEAVLTYSDASPTVPNLDRATLANISLVCRRWRQNSLENGKLWAVAFDFDRDTSAWFQELVRRSKTSPISISSSKGSFYSYFSSRKKDLLEKFTSQKWQEAFKLAALWGAFSLQTALPANKENLAALDEGLKQPTPKLESFTLINTHRAFPANLGPEEVQFTLPNNLFAGSAPHLKTFIVDQVFFPSNFNFSVWNNLTYLNVSQDVFRARQNVMRRTTQNWLDILRPLTMLEKLDLHDVFSTSDKEHQSGFASVPDVHFKRLSLLKLSTGFAKEMMFDLFVKIVVPSSCSIAIHIHHWGFRFSDYPRLAFKKLRYGMDRHIRRVLANNQNGSLAVDLQNSLDGIEFGLDVWLYDDSEGSANRVWRPLPIFTFLQSRTWPNGTEDLTRSAMETLETIPRAPTSAEYPFSQLLAAMKNLPASELLITSWPRIVADDVGPLCRFLSRCEHADAVEIYDTDVVILDILQRKLSTRRGPLLPNLSSFQFDPAFKEDIPRLEAFRLWRESIGKLPTRFEIHDV
ncbi:hypothetical protein BDN70DRAFT_993691 [Pholiota conissans]|uniref:F-box domain-containing protein n=1 Tax=Pholiota conissans TaxID=109636 RepID=A0A9P5Z3G5_9AGAR|nr:hypothetical protein BDN70DRAFT_993691 [Pholiota conissans]